MTTGPKSWPIAKYREVEDPSEEGNPFIEALPPMPTRNELLEGLTRYLPLEPFLKMRTRRPEIRLVALLKLRNLYQPGRRDEDLAWDVISHLRAGYLNRNPVGKNFMATLKRGIAALHDSGFDPDPEAAANGLAVIGVSGMGKTTSTRIVLECLPRVIRHEGDGRYDTKTYQIVWMKVNCPKTGSVRKLCQDIILAVDRLIGETYARKHAIFRATESDLQIALVAVANAHGLGLLVIDEIQNLKRASVGDRAITLTFLVSLMNGLGVPVVLVGTKDALPIIEGAVPTARRTAGYYHEYARYKLRGAFALFMEVLWQYQLVDDPVELDGREPADPERRKGTPPSWTCLFYHYCQGIPDIAVKLFVEAQRAAIARAKTGERSTITPDIVASVWNKRFKLMHVHVARLRAGMEPSEPAFSDALAKLGARFEASGTAEPPASDNEMPDGLDQSREPEESPDRPGVARARARPVSRTAHAKALGAAATRAELAKAKENPVESTLGKAVAEGTKRGIAPHQAVGEKAYEAV